MKALGELIEGSKDALTAGGPHLRRALLWAGKGVEFHPGRGWVFSPGPFTAVITHGHDLYRRKKAEDCCLGH